MRILGGIVTALGIFLLLGNVFHFFPTFPFAGYLTIVVGGIIMKQGTKKHA